MAVKKTSRKTTIAGIMVAIGLILVAVAALLDGNPETVANWGGVIKAVQGAGWLSTGLGATLTGILARDNDKSSEDVGAR